MSTWRLAWQLNVVGSVQIFEDLLRDSLEYRSGNLSTLMQANRRIQNNCHRDRWIIYQEQIRRMSPRTWYANTHEWQDQLFAPVPVFPAEL